MATKIEGRMVLDNGQFMTTIQRTEQRLQGFQRNIEQISRAVTTVFATAAIGRAIQSLINFNDELGKTAQRIGVAVDKLNGLQFAAGQTGASAEKLNVALRQLAKNVLDFSNGTGEARVAFQAMGISVKDASGNLKSVDVVLGEVADRFSKVKDGTEKAAIAQKLFGESGVSMIPLLNQGADGMKKLVDEGNRLRPVTEANAKAAADFNDAVDRLMTAIQGLLQKALTPLLPKLTDAADGMQKFSDVGDGLVFMIAKLGQSIQVLTGPMNAIIASITYGSFALAEAIQGNFSVALQTIQDLKEEINAINADSSDALGRLFSMSTSLETPSEAKRRKEREALDKKVNDLAASFNTPYKGPGLGTPSLGDIKGTTGLADLRLELARAEEELVNFEGNDPNRLANIKKLITMIKHDIEVELEDQKFRNILGDKVFGQVTPEQFTEHQAIRTGLNNALTKEYKAIEEERQESLAKQAMTYTAHLKQTNQADKELTEKNKAELEKRYLEYTDFLKRINAAQKALDDERARLPGIRAQGRLDRLRAGPQPGYAEFGNQAKIAQAEIQVLLAEFQRLGQEPILTPEQEERMNLLAVKMQELNKVTNEMPQLWKDVRDAVKSSIQEMTTGILRGTQTMAEAFRNLFENVLTSILNRGLQRMTDVFFDFAASSGGSKFLGGILGTIGGLFTSADGNVMTGRGPMKLQSFAGGGVARGPMVSIFGEGSTPEAYVPLPDGRRIPVALQGGGGETQVIVNNHTPTPAKVTQQRNPRGGKSILIEIGEALGSQVENRGPLGQSIERAFGLSLNPQVR